MKKILSFYSAFLFILFGVPLILFFFFTSQVRAYEPFASVNCYPSYSNAGFDSFPSFAGENGSEQFGLAAVRYVYGTLSINVNYNSYSYGRRSPENMEGYLYYKGSWKQVPIYQTSWMDHFLVKTDLSFSKTGIEPIAVFIREKTRGEKAYCGGKIWIYEEERVDPPWSFPTLTTYNAYKSKWTSPNINSPKGQLIGGAKLNFKFFNRYAYVDCTKPEYNYWGCGFYKLNSPTYDVFPESASDAGNNKPFTKVFNYVWRTGGETTSLKFILQGSYPGIDQGYPDLFTNCTPTTCWVEAKLSYPRFTLYTRPSGITADQVQLPQPPTGTINPTTTPIPTSSPQPTPTTIYSTGWRIRGSVYQSGTTTGIAGVIISLYGSTTDPRTNGNLGTKITTTTTDSTGRYKLDSFNYYPYFTIVKEGNPVGYTSSFASCGIGEPTCVVLSADKMQYYFGHDGTEGYYQNNNYYIKR